MVWKNSLSILSLSDFIQCISRMFSCWVSKTEGTFFSKDQLDLLLCFSSVFSNTEWSTKALMRPWMRLWIAAWLFCKRKVECLFVFQFRLLKYCRGEALGLKLPVLACSEE